MLGAVETTNKTLTSSQKEYDNKFSAFDNPRYQEASVEEIENKGCNNSDQENIDEDEDLSLIISVLISLTQSCSMMNLNCGFNSVRLASLYGHFR